MQEPKNIAANWTSGIWGNILHASSRDNVLALVRGDRIGGLAIYRAATSWRMPGWNCLKRQKYNSAGIRLRMKGSAETVPCGRRQYLKARLCKRRLISPQKRRNKIPQLYLCFYSSFFTSSECRFSLYHTGPWISLPLHT